MSMYVSKEQDKALKVINKVNCITKDQLVKMNIFKGTHSLTVERKLEIFNLYAQDKYSPRFKIVDDEYYLSLTKDGIDKDMIKCLDVLLSFDQKDIKWFGESEYPFKLTISKAAADSDNVKIFDVAVLKIGEEVIFNKVLDQSCCERLILIVDKEKAGQYKEIKTEKMIMYCTLNPIRYYEELSGINAQELKL